MSVTKNNQALFVEVILPLAISNTFTYSVPKELMAKLLPGMRVEVQFGKKKLYAAIITRMHKEKPGNYIIKPILSLLDAIPVINEKQLVLWEWLASYYMCTIGEVMHAALPAAFKLSSESSFILHQAYEAMDTTLPSDLSGKELLVIEALRYHDSLSLEQIQDIVHQRSVYPLVRSLMDKDIMLIYETLREKYKPKSVDHIQLHERFKDKKAMQQLFGDLEKTPAQLNILLSYLQLSKSGQAISRSELLKSVKASASTLSSLIKKDVFTISRKEIGRLNKQTDTSAESLVLSDKQKDALKQVKGHFKKKDVVLLHGITSSGKTLLYVHLIKEQLKKGKQVLYLLPEIALTAQIINRLSKYFGKDVGIYHSKFSNNERVEIWNKTLKKEYKIVLGARSALFLPFDDLGLIIIDEEHDSSFKQFDPAPRYNARDAAIYLAKIHGAKTLLGTATPSLESYYNTKTNKYGLVEMHERYGGVKPPQVNIIDLKIKGRDRMKPGSIVSRIMTKHIQEALDIKEQVILFQNRRGYVPFTECNTCGWTPQCTNCDVSLTYHKFYDELRCHYCGYKVKQPASCSACGSKNIQVKGFGTERIEEELQLLFPEAKVGRMDWDTTRTKYGHDKIIAQFEEREIDILVGTQMVTKGLDFDNVSMVGILSADNLLNYPDLRANERAYQLISQVSGRAGRKKKQGQVYLQTYDPGNAVIQYTINSDYQGFYDMEIQQRDSFKYPPFFRLVKFTLKHHDKKVLDKAANYLAFRLKAKFKENILGPEYNPIPRLRNKYIKNILIKLDVRTASLTKDKNAIKSILDDFEADKKYRSVIVQADVDTMG